MAYLVLSICSARVGLLRGLFHVAVALRRKPWNITKMHVYVLRSLTTAKIVCLWIPANISSVIVGCFRGVGPLPCARAIPRASSSRGGGANNRSVGDMLRCRGRQSVGASLHSGDVGLYCVGLPYGAREICGVR